MAIPTIEELGSRELLAANVLAELTPEESGAELAIVATMDESPQVGSIHVRGWNPIRKQVMICDATDASRDAVFETYGADTA